MSSRGAQSTELVSLYIGYWTLNNYYYYYYLIWSSKLGHVIFPKFILISSLSSGVSSGLILFLLILIVVLPVKTIECILPSINFCK